MVWADLTDPWIAELERKVRERPAQLETIKRVNAEHGFGVTNYYGDGVVRMAEGNGTNDLAVFIRPDGTTGPIHSVASLRACAEIIEARKAVAA